MYFSILSLMALIATSSATYVPLNGTSTWTSTTAAYYPTGTGSWKPTSTAAPTQPTYMPPFTGGAAMPTHFAGKALGMAVAGGVVLML
ncbi:hypothetical protein IQ06DRAFT_288777 [Phaeosphaeriaceae sp. SRC1lsM3a]|nr:hypothetical protein IQ06DRAFT_288777 [Stagonospora sp. SRC1lsM3a]